VRNLWGRKDDKPEKRFSDDRIFRQEGDYHYPIVYAASGKIPLTWNTATYHLVITAISSSNIPEADGFTPQVGTDTAIIRQLPINEPVDAEVWQSLLSKPWTHLIHFYYYSNHQQPKNLLYYAVNCRMQFEQADAIAYQIGKSLVAHALLETKTRPLLDGIEVRLYGCWLLTTFAAYKPRWQADRRKISWGG
jgi:hypothetical protein